MNKYIYTLVILFLSFKINAQTREIEPFLSDSETEVTPLNASSKNNFSQFIYLGSEIKKSGKITKLTFQVGEKKKSPIEKWNKWKVSLKQIDKEGFEVKDVVNSYGSTNTKIIHFKNLTTVYDKEITYNEKTKTVSIILETPFVYNHNKNLVVEVIDKSGGSTSGWDKKLTFLSKSFFSYTNTDIKVRNTNISKYSTITDKDANFDKSNKNNYIVPYVKIEIEAPIEKYCQGDVLELSTETNDNFSYSWKSPQGKVTYGNSLKINNIKLSDQGFYTLTSTNGSCTNDIQEVYIKVNSAPKLTTNVSTPKICYGSSFNLTNFNVSNANNDKTSITYHSASPANKSNLIANTNVSPLVNTNYYILASNGICSNEIKVSVNVAKEIIPSLTTPKNTICSNQEITFTADGGDIYEFFVNDISKVKSNKNTFKSTFNDKDKVKVKVFKGDCFKISKTITVKVIKVPKPTTTLPTPKICYGSSFNLTDFNVSNANNDKTSITYHSASPANKSNVIANTNVSPLVNTNYYILASNGICSNEIKVSVNVAKEIIPSLTTPKNTICSNQEITFTANGGDIYEFFVNDISKVKSNKNTFKSTFNDKDKVKVKMFKGDCFKISKTITVKHYIKTNSGEEGEITINREAPTEEELFNSLDGTPDENGVWKKEKGYYTYTVTNDCSSSTTRVNIIRKESEKEEFELLNFFTPNNDSKNDKFIVLKNLLKKYPNNKITIYTRNGTAVYKAQPYMNNWTGEDYKSSARDKRLKPGSYLYILELNDSKKTIIKNWVYLTY